VGQKIEKAEYLDELAKRLAVKKEMVKEGNGEWEK